MLINKKKLRIIKVFLLSSPLHQIILILYLVSLPILMSAYTAKRFFHPASTHDYYALKQVLFPDAYRNMSSISDCYHYLNNLIGTPRHNELLHLDVYLPDTFAYFAPASAMRIAQNRIVRPTSCDSASDASQFYSSTCNPFDSSSMGLGAYVAAKSTDCADSGCGEYIPTVIETPFDGLYTYPANVLQIMIGGQGKTEAHTMIGKLETNRWIDNETRCLLVDMNILTPESEFAIRGAVEMVDTHIVNIFADISRVDTSPFTASKIIVLLIYVLPATLYTLRIVFQISLSYSVLMNIFELAHVVIIHAYFIINLIVTYKANKKRSQIGDLSRYMELLSLVKLLDIETYLLSISFFFYPFRACALLAYVKWMQPVVKVLRIIFRMLPTILLINGIMICTALCAAISLEGIYAGGLKDVGDFRKILEQLLSIGYSISSAVPRTFANSNLVRESDVDEFFLILANVWRMTMVAIQVASCVYAYKRALQMEGIDVKGPEKEAEIATIETIRSTTSKILGNYKEGTTNEEKLTEKKIILWLRAADTGTRELARSLEEIHHAELVINQFYSANVLKKFLKVLFRIKPTLATKNAATKLSVVLECSEVEHVEQLVWFLRDSGAAVPLLVYKLPGFDDKLLSRLKAKYNKIQSCDTIGEIGSFVTAKI